jgi:MoaA/NifB/PqqE/SkfB family radical SAM enzyme
MNPINKYIRLLQAFRHYKQHSTVLPYFPVRMWVETTNACNLRCTMCPNATDFSSIRGNMDINLFTAIADQISGRINDINLSHRGEPLFHPDLEQMIRIASDRDLATRIHTNATLLDRHRAASLLDAGPDLLSFSFDGYDKASYESVRIGGVYEETLENIRFFLAEKKRLGLDKPYTIVQIIEPPGITAGYRENLHRFGDRLRSYGLDKFYVKKPHNWAGNAPDQYPLHQKYIACTFLYYSMTVLWNGLVCPCPQDWYGTQVLGDLTEQTVEEVWNGDLYRDMRRRSAARDLDGWLCQNCDRVFRPSVWGIPTENLKSFLGETLAGYRLARKLIRK